MKRTPSPELGALIGAEPITPPEAVQRLWAYVQKNGLQEPGNAAFRLDAPLKAIFGPVERATLIDVAMKLAAHLGLEAGPVDRVKLELVTEGLPPETPWAVPLGNGRYRIDNMPFFAYGISLGDVVEAEPREGATPLVKRVVEKSGNRTLRLFFEGGVDLLPAQRLLEQLQKLGCEVEGGFKKLLCVSVPPAVELGAVIDLVNAAKVAWEFADPKAG